MRQKRKKDTGFILCISPDNRPLRALTFIVGGRGAAASLLSYRYATPTAMGPCCPAAVVAPLPSAGGVERRLERMRVPTAAGAPYAHGMRAGPIARRRPLRERAPVAFSFVPTRAAFFRGRADTREQLWLLPRGLPRSFPSTHDAHERRDHAII